MDSKKTNHSLFGVQCSAYECAYQSDGCCHAGSISVQSPSALKKQETFCSTFCPSCGK